jgi:hypothetical protein
MIDIGRDFQRMQDYIVGRLSDDEHRAFEDRLQRDPVLVRELEQSLRLREGLQQLRAEGQLASAAPLATLLRIWPILAAAAIVAVALFLRAQLSPVTSPVLTASLESPGAAPSLAARFTFVAMRDGATPQLELPTSGVIEFRAAPGVRGTAYGITLVRRDAGSATTVGTLKGVAPGADGYVHSYADASRLTPGSYLLRVEPETRATRADQVFAFSFRAHGLP